MVKDNFGRGHTCIIWSLFRAYIDQCLEIKQRSVGILFWFVVLINPCNHSQILLMTTAIAWQQDSSVCVGALISELWVRKDSGFAKAFSCLKKSSGLVQCLVCRFQFLKNHLYNMSGFFPQSSTVTCVSSAQAWLISYHPLLNLEIHKVIHFLWVL